MILQNGINQHLLKKILKLFANNLYTIIQLLDFSESLLFTRYASKLKTLSPILFHIKKEDW